MPTDTRIRSLKEKIDELNLRAWNIRVNDSESAFELSKESVALARDINYEKGLAWGLVTLGFCYVRLSRNDEALPALKESLSLFESQDDKDGLSAVYEYLGVVQRNWGDLGGALELLLKALAFTEQTNTKENEATNHYQIGVNYKYLGDFDKALEHLYQSITAAKEIKNNPLYEAYSINMIGSIYFETGDYNQALDYYKQGLIARHEAGDKWGEAGSLDNIGSTYLKLLDYGKAIDFCKRSLEITKTTGDKKGEANTLLHLAEIYRESNNTEKAEEFCNESLKIRHASGDKKGEAENFLFLADIHKNALKKEEQALVLQWLSGALSIAEEIKALDLLSKTRKGLYAYHKKAGNFKDAIDQLELYMNAEGELHKNTISQKVQNLEITHKAEEEKKEADIIRLKNEELTKLNREIEEQKNKLEEVVTDLKATQAQLIQSEKMASLGELTAGIAHEIQNPLNFVNNFSEVNKELLAEMNEEIKKGNYDEVKSIAEAITENEEKINHHGKRADGIVKGMLQHSRSSSGVKEPTDINALADEYLRLAYHGLRAKDKSFNATMKTDFDESIGPVNIIPQDIGRVILNLITNAFYAVTEKKKASSGSAGQLYEPTVTVTTKHLHPPLGGLEGALIIVGDNGNGIPPKALDKIFQPFFTTKPTGQGTGLGLSLSYDIIKTHGGEITVETKEGEGTTFTIQLPA